MLIGILVVIIGAILYVVLQEKGADDKSKIVRNRLGKLDDLMLDAMEPSIISAPPFSEKGFKEVTENEVSYQIYNAGDFQLIVFVMLVGRELKVQVNFLNIQTNKKAKRDGVINTEEYTRQELLGIIQVYIAEAIEQTL